MRSGNRDDLEDGAPKHSPGRLSGRRRARAESKGESEVQATGDKDREMVEGMKGRLHSSSLN